MKSIDLFDKYISILIEYPGVIQLKQPCQAYDRRYVKCVIKAEKIARAFQNGFPILYSFKEMNFEYDSINHDIHSMVFIFKQPKSLPSNTNTR